jgi:hypothetical protein
MKYGLRLFIICSWALLLTQAPAFILQYKNHLAGHLQELKYQENILKKMMQEVNLPGLAIKLKQSHEFYGIRQGEYIESFISRKEKFDASNLALINASSWSVGFYFLRYFDLELAQETVEDFNFGIPFTFAGLIYGLLGALIGNFIWLGLVKLFRQERPEVISDV